MDDLFSLDDILTPEQMEIRRAVQKICADFPDAYWLKKDDEHSYPHEFANAMAKAGFLGICYPPAYGGSGLGITEAAIVAQTVAEGGGANTGMTSIIHAIFGLHPVVKHGTEEQKRRWLPAMMSRQDRSCFGVTEPNAGLDTTRISTFAERRGDTYYVRGQKIWTSGAQQATKIMLLARTKKIEATKRPIDGLSIFFTDLDRRHVEIREIPKMGRHGSDSNQVFFNDLPVPKEDLIGEEGKGFHYLLDGLNPERILNAAGLIGTGIAALRRATRYAKERIVFDRPIGKNQAIQHPLANNWCELQAALLMNFKAAQLYDAGKSCGHLCNAAKHLAAEACYRTCEQAVLTHGGMGYAKEFHVERYLREAWVMRIGPVTSHMILNYIGERVLGLPKSY